MRCRSSFWLGLCIAASCIAPLKAAEFWFGGLDPVHKNAPQDYMDLFASNAPWQRGASRLSVFKIAAETVLLGSDDMLRSIFDTMRSRHVAIALEMGALMQDPSETCGGGEGYMLPIRVQKIGAKLRRLGFTLDYMAMDGPVWLGHERFWGVTKGRPDCQYPLAEVVRRAARTVSMMRQNFPAIRVGEIDAVNSRIDPRQVLSDYAAFAQMMQRATGAPLAFFHCDTAWQFPNWQRIIVALRAQTHAAGMRFGVIIGGSQEDQSNARWVADGLQRLSFLANPATRPDDVIVQSWQDLPTRMLPETLPGTSTYMLAQAERLLP